MIRKRIASLILDSQKIPPEIRVGHHILAESVPLLRHFQHLVKSFLKAGKGHFLLQFRCQLPGAHCHQHAQSAALLHGFMQKTYGPVIILRKPVSCPHILMTAQTAGQNAGGIPVPRRGSLLQKGEGLSAPSGPFVVVNVLKCLPHLSAQCPAHVSFSFFVSF